MRAEVMRVALRSRNGNKFPDDAAEFYISVRVQRGTPEWDRLWAAGLSEDHGVEIAIGECQEDEQCRSTD